jgi:hypothetical protein
MKVLETAYFLYSDQRCWLIEDDDRELYEVRTLGDSTEADAFAFKDYDQKGLDGKVLSWFRVT